MGGRISMSGGGRNKNSKGTRAPALILQVLSDDLINYFHWLFRSSQPVRQTCSPKEPGPAHFKNCPIYLNSSQQERIAILPPSPNLETLIRSMNQASSPRHSPKSISSTSSSNGEGSINVHDSESSEEWGSSDSSEHESFESFLRKNRCMRYYLEWNACVDQAIWNGQDHRIHCCRLSKVLRNCVRLS